MLGGFGCDGLNFVIVELSGPHGRSGLQVGPMGARGSLRKRDP